MIKFYDTCSLLLEDESALDEKFAISSLTLEELENIKTSSHKDDETKYLARKLTKFLATNPSKYTVHIYRTSMVNIIETNNLPVTNDTKILATAYDYERNFCPDDMLFVTNDLALMNIANLFFGQDSIISVEEIKEDYEGFTDLILSDEEMISFYSHQNENLYNLLPNQYLIIRDAGGEIVDKLKWDGASYVRLTYGNFNSFWFNKVKPKENDPYQAFLSDSFATNKLTMVKGPAGSGKTYLSLTYMMAQLEKHKIDRIVIFCNTVATANSAKLGYYPGTRDEKLLDSQIGNLLISKLGGREGVENLMGDGKLVLLPMSDIRGYDTSGIPTAIYISEAQNLDVSLMKLALQRVGEDGFCIIDGDCKAQVDDISFAGNNNGMRRLSKVFRGEHIYGEVTLKNIYRSEIARIAELM